MKNKYWYYLSFAAFIIFWMNSSNPKLKYYSRWLQINLANTTAINTTTDNNTTTNSSISIPNQTNTTSLENNTVNVTSIQNTTNTNISLNNTFSNLSTSIQNTTNTITNITNTFSNTISANTNISSNQPNTYTSTVTNSVQSPTSSVNNLGTTLSNLSNPNLTIISQNSNTIVSVNLIPKNYQINDTNIVNNLEPVNTNISNQSISSQNAINSPINFLSNLSSNLTILNDSVKQQTFLTQVQKNSESIQTLNISAQQSIQVSQSLNYVLDTITLQISIGQILKPDPIIFQIADSALQASSNSQNMSQIEKSKTSLVNLFSSLSKNMIANMNHSQIQLISENFGAQIYQSGSNKFSLKKSQIKQVNTESPLSIINITECESFIKQKYNFSDGIYVQKIDFFKKINNLKNSNSSTQNGSSVEFLLFNPLSGNEINVTLDCSNISIAFHIPNPNVSSINSSFYNFFYDQGIQLNDPKNIFFTDRCYIYKDPLTGLTMTLKERQNQNSRAVKCNQGCILNGFDTNGFIKCNCTAVTKTDVSIDDILFETISSLNFGVIKCVSSVVTTDTFFNVGFFSILVINILLGSIFFTYRYYHKILIQSNLIKIIHNDAELFEKEKMDIKKYFIKDGAINDKFKVLKNKGNISPRSGSSIPIQFSKNHVIDTQVNNISVFTRNYDKKEKNTFQIEPNIIKIDRPTIRDYLKLSFEELKIYDKRNFFEYLKDIVQIKHSVISTFFNFSILIPQYIRVLSFFCGLNFVFALNALVYNDNFVAQSNLNSNNTQYRFGQAIIRALISVGFNLILNQILGILRFVPSAYQYLLNEALKSKNLDVIHNGWDIFNNYMKIRYLVLVIFSISIIFFSWYYVICFCGVYITTQWNWFIGGVCSLLLNWCIIEFLIPFSMACIRFLAFKKNYFILVFKISIKLGLA